MNQEMLDEMEFKTVKTKSPQPNSIRFTVHRNEEKERESRTVANAGRGETARSTLLLLNVVRALAATTAQSVRLIIPLTESGGTLSYNHFLCCLRSTEMHSWVLIERSCVLF